MKRLRSPWVLAGVVVLGLGYWLYDGMRRSYGPYGVVRRTACLSNLKQIGRAALLYAEDSDGRLMPGARWMDVLEPKLNSPEVLRCPCLVGLGQDGPDAWGYALNSLVSGQAVKNYEEPDRTFLAYESKKTERHAADPMTSFSGPFDPERPKTGRANVVFLDGHAQRVGKF